MLNLAAWIEWARPPPRGVISTLRAGCHFYLAPTTACRRPIKMSPLCKVDVTLARVLGSGRTWCCVNEPSCVLLPGKSGHPRIAC